LLYGRQNFDEQCHEISSEIIIKDLHSTLYSFTQKKLVHVINGTGVILHTNLGRAPLGKNNIHDNLKIFESYSNLEYDLEKGRRGKRKSPVQKQLQALTGADDIAIVNNNAAAVYLTLKAFASGGEAIVSRGELVEIGGSFRVPDIMAQSGTHMIEVGTTNRTRLSDYENAITPKTKVLFKAHQSNFYQDGFTEEVSIKDLAALAKKHKLIFIYDLGCGLLKNFDAVKFLDQPSVEENIKDDADLVLFSGDKLLGGPQCGIIAGKKEYLSIIDKHPLMRALRVDKMTLATLQNTLSHYFSEKNLKNIPFYNSLLKTQDELKSTATELQKILATNLEDENLTTDIIKSQGKCGGGTTPNIVLDTYCVTIQHSKFTADKIFHALLSLDIPVVGILKEGQFMIDTLCIEYSDIPIIAEALKKILCPTS